MSTNDTKQRVTLAEHLSAMLDDEAGTFEQKRVLDELKTDTALAKKLAHFALIKETLHSREASSVYAGTSFLEGIHDKLEAEPEFTSHALDDAISSSVSSTPSSADSGTKNSNGWLRPVGGFAMAASVAALAVIGFQNYLGNTQSENSPAIETLVKSDMDKTTAAAAKNQLTQAQMDSAVLADTGSVVSPETADQNDKLAALDYRQADAQTRSLLKRYVDSHMQYASSSAFVPSVRVIAYSDY
jgi:negative regulator of sigma E activity